MDIKKAIFPKANPLITKIDPGVLSVGSVHIPFVDLGEKKTKCSVTDDLVLIIKTPHSPVF